MDRNWADDICWVFLATSSILYYVTMAFGTAFFIAMVILTVMQPTDQWKLLVLWIFLAVGGFNVARCKGWQMMVYFLTNREEVRW